MKKYLYRFILIVLLLGSILSLGYRILGFEELRFLHYFEIAASMGLLLAFCVLKIKGRLIIGAVVLFLYFVNLYANGFGRIWETVLQYGEWLALRDGEHELLPLFQCIQLFLLSLVCFMLAYLIERYKGLRYGMFLFCFLLAIIFVVCKTDVSSISAAFLWTYILFHVVEIVEKCFSKIRLVEDKKTYMVFLWPVWTLFLLLMFIAPSSEKPFDWSFAKQLYTRCSEQISVLFEKVFYGEREDYTAMFSGFTEEGKLGGDITDNSEPVLKVKSASESMSNIYLQGAVMNAFDGRQWKQCTPSKRELFFDTVEALYAARRFDAEHVYNYLSGLSIDIEFQHFRSRHMFLPSKTYSVMAEDLHDISLLNSDSLLWDKTMTYKDCYSLFFYQLNIGQEAFDAFLESPVPETQESFQVTRSHYGMKGIGYEELLAYRDLVKNQYTETVTLSPEVTAWISEATAGCQTKLERLRAIESALQQFTYATDVGKLPESISNPNDYLKYFLLESKSGYCTYFATAFSLLARAEGFPTRYVQGYCVPMDGKKECVVTGDMAHAWPEVYFEGIGWIPFEPTPGYQENRYTEWILRGDGGAEAPYSEENYPDFFNWNKPEEQEEIVAEEKQQFSLDARLIWFGLILAIIFCILFVWLDKVLAVRRMERLSPREKYLFYIRRSLSILGKIGFLRQEDETLGELDTRVKTQYRTWEKTPPEFIGEYEQVIYGDRNVTEEMVALMRQEHKSLMLQLGRLDLLLERYWVWKNC